MRLKPETAPEDIGLFAADAFDNPEEYPGRDLEIASEELTGPQIAEVFEKVSGLLTCFQELPLGQVRQFNEEFGNMFGWFNDEGFRSDIPALRARYPELTTMEAWARHEWTVPAAQ
ncbi:NmrA family NAD(P)-binding protein [Streptomyces sp. NPDC005055]